MRSGIPAAAALLLALPVASAADTRRLPAPGTPIAFEVAVISGITGAPVPGATVVAWGRRLVDAGSHHRTDSVPLVRGARGCGSPVVTLPPGWVTEAELRGHMDPIVTLFTRTLRRTVVAWPAARVQVVVRGADGRPVADVMVAVERAFPPRVLRFTTPSSKSWSTGDEEPVASGCTDARGEIAFDGIPAIPATSYRARTDGMVPASVSKSAVLDRADVTSFDIVFTEGREQWGRGRGGAFL
jgi:hypothetical protein